MCIHLHHLGKKFASRGARWIHVWTKQSKKMMRWEKCAHTFLTYWIFLMKYMLHSCFFILWDLHFEKTQFSPMKVWAWPLMMLISWYFYIGKPLVLHPHIILSLMYWLLHSIIIFTYPSLFTFLSIILFHLNFNFVALKSPFLLIILFVMWRSIPHWTLVFSFVW